MPDDFFQPLVRDANFQTVWGTLLRPFVGGDPSTRVATVRETWTLPDGDLLDVELLPHRPKKPGVVVLHGLEGSSSAGYVRGALAAADARGWNGLIMNFRSCGWSEHRFARTYHSGFTSDARFALETLRARGVSPLGLVGFSLGGNVTAKLMGESGADAPADAAVAVSVPFDLAACAHTIDGAGIWRRAYRRRFMSTLKSKALVSARRFPGALDAAKIRQSDTFAQFDEHVTARLFGFDSADDYWTKSSSAGFLGGIRKPVLLISAEDDPMIPASSIPREAIAKNAAITARIVPHGGHVGFVSGSFGSPHYAAEALAIGFLAGVLEPR